MSKKNEKIAARPGSVRIPSSEVETQAEGWVVMSAYRKRKHTPYLGAAQTVDEDILKDDNAPTEDRKREMRKFDELLGAFVYDWDWKDQDGTPYPSPYQNPEAFGELRIEEWAWLVGKVTEIVAQERGVPKANTTP